MEAIATLIVFVLGSCIGSFLNVVVYRIPAKISLMWPPSRCPRCFHKLGVRENVPIFGWLWLLGRCHWCKTRISPRYPLIEAVTGCIFMFVFSEFGLTLNTLGYWALLSWLMALALIDIDTMTLPNVLTESGLLLGLVFQGVKGWQEGQTSGLANHIMMAIVAATIAIWLFELILIFGNIILGQAAMGGGDPKLAAMIGAWLGWQLMLLTAFIACVLGAFIGGGAIALGLITRRQPIPFGPFLALGAGLSLFWGPQIISNYFKLFFPLS